MASHACQTRNCLGRSSKLAPQLTRAVVRVAISDIATRGARFFKEAGATRSEEHTFEIQSLMRISYAAFCLKTIILNSYNSHSVDNNRTTDDNTTSVVTVNNSTTIYTNNQ